MKDIKRIIWISSYPKSGNTWFRAFLSNLFSKSDNPININDFLGLPMASSRKLFDDYTGVSSANLSHQEIELIRPKVYKKLATQNDEFLFIKVHDAWKLISSGDQLFPAEATKCVIYLVRNPLDILVSYSNHSSKAYIETLDYMNDKGFSVCHKADRLYNQVKQDLTDWSTHIKSWIDDSNLPVHVIRYEDMLNHSFETFSKAIRYLGFDFDKTEIQKAIEFSKFSNLVELERKHGFKEKPPLMNAFFHQGAAEGWQNKLDIYMINEIRKHHFRMMKRFGYNVESIQ